MRRKEERSKQGQTNNKAEQHSTPKAVTLPKKRVHVQLYLQLVYCIILQSWHYPQSEVWVWPKCTLLIEALSYMYMYVHVQRVYSLCNVYTVMHVCMCVQWWMYVQWQGYMYI